MMGGWGPRTPEQLKEAKEDARISQAVKPWREKVGKLEARIAKQDRIIKLMRKHIKMSSTDDFVLDLLEELLEGAE